MPCLPQQRSDSTAINRLRAEIDFRGTWRQRRESHRYSNSYEHYLHGEKCRPSGTLLDSIRSSRPGPGHNPPKVSARRNLPVFLECDINIALLLIANAIRRAPLVAQSALCSIIPRQLPGGSRTD